MEVHVYVHGSVGNPPHYDRAYDDRGSLTSFFLANPLFQPQQTEKSASSHFFPYISGICPDQDPKMR